MTNKRKWGTAALSVLLATSLAACGGGNEATNGASPSPGSGNSGGDSKPVTLTMWGGVPAEAGPQAVVDAWNAENPDVQVKYERFVNDDAGNLKLDTALATNQNIDLYVTYNLPVLVKRVEAGNALDLNTYGDYNIDEKMGEDAKAWKVKDSYYGMPTKKNVSFVWLNKNALDEAGLPVPPLDWNMGDLQKYAKALTKEKRFGYVMDMSAYNSIFDGTNAGSGYTKTDGSSNLDDPNVKKAYETLYNMQHTDKSMPTLGEQLTSKMPTDAAFLKGEAAMLGAGEFVFRSANNLKDFPHDFQIAFAMIPKVSADQSNFKYPGGLGDVISINPKSENKDKAWEFLKWYADGGMKPLAAGGRIPASKDADIGAALDTLLGSNKEGYDVKSLEEVVFGKFPTYTVPLSQQVVDARREEYEKYFTQSQSIEDTLKNTVKRHNDFVKNSK
ncbi:extracellular solute-binding protein [Paenibacillus pasadenensis]|uniref:ABC transporter substrate-binding protein n=1 Tax=Paenibacillus pasadenensis TaxID=217090 RepID=UPI00203CC2F0|nr:extracellular solute-binding protein [Paenibacillus pasadenensis]MCM3749664.1 extracellular solute-binding protein [Paenibacillus pasadenensis]